MLFCSSVVLMLCFWISFLQRLQFRKSYIVRRENTTSVTSPCFGCDFLIDSKSSSKNFVGKAHCEQPEMVVSGLENPDLDIFFQYYYRGAGWLMKFMVNSIPDKSIQRIGRVLDKSKYMKSHIAAGVLENPIAFMIFLTWNLLGGLLIFLVVLHFACRMLYVRKGKQPTSQNMILASLSFLLCVVTSFVGIIFFSYSLSHVRDGIELLPRHLRRTAQDFTKFTNDLNVSVHCIHNHQDRKLKDKVEVISKKIKESVDRFKTEINEYRFEDIIQSIASTRKGIKKVTKLTSKLTKALKRKLGLDALKSIDAVLPPLSDGSDEILGILKRTNKKMDKGFEQVEADKGKVFAAYANYTATLEQVVAFARLSTIRTQKQFADVFTERSSHRISSLLGYTVLIPIMLLALSLLGLAGIMGSWRFYTGSDRFDSRLSRRGATANVASSVLASAGYVALLLGSLLCFMTAFCFLVAFVAMFVCMGVFEDNDLRLLQAVPNLHYTTSFGSQQIVYSLHDILYKCRNDYPFFDAVNGSYLMAEKELSTKFSMSRRYDMAREVQNFHVDPTTLAKMEANTREVDNHASRFEKAVVTNRKETPDNVVQDIYDLRYNLSSLATKMTEAVGRISNLTKIENRLPISDALRSDNALLQKTFLRVFSKIFDHVVDVSPRCDTLLKIWNVIGGYTCTWVSAPMQGLWIACMFCVIGSSAIYHAFFNTERFLHKCAESTKDVHARRKRREEKFKYIRRKMKELEGKGTPKIDSGEKSDESSNSGNGSASNATTAETGNPSATRSSGPAPTSTTMPSAEPSGQANAGSATSASSQLARRSRADSMRTLSAESTLHSGQGSRSRLSAVGTKSRLPAENSTKTARNMTPRRRRDDE